MPDLLRPFLALILCALLSACGPGGDEAVVEPARRRALADLTPTPVTTTELLDWAEQVYPTLFPGHEANLRFDPYTYRYYPATRNYVGVGDGKVYLMGPVAASLAGDRYLGEPYAYSDVATLTCVIHPDRCGRKTVHRITVGGQSREFIVYVPWKAQAPGARMPAVLMLHGTSGDGERFYSISGWREKADAEGMVVVFPTALVHCLFNDANHNGIAEAGEVELATKGASGSTGVIVQLCGADQLARLNPTQRAQADHPLADDITFMGAILDTLRSDYPVDMKRVYASGFSNGGSMTARMVVQMADRFAAFGVAAGRLLVAPLPPARLPPVVYSVGTLDDLEMATLGTTNPLPLTAALGEDPMFRQEVTGPLVTALRLSPSGSWSAQDIGRVHTSRFVHRPLDAGATHQLTVWIIDGATHEYPNGTNHPVKMVDLLWEAFRGVSLP